MTEISQSVIEAESLNNYLKVTRAAGLPDSLAEETYAEAIVSLSHNSGEAPEVKDVGGIAGDRLRSFIERIERLEEEKKALQEDIKEVYAEAKGVGFDAPTIRKVVAERKKDPEKRNEQLELFDLYKTAIGMI